jgi:hypothetical protein
MATTYKNPGSKAFSWSYSKLKNYASCPKRHYEIEIAKSVKEEESDNLKWGDQVHAGMHKRLQDNIPLPEAMESYEEWAVKLQRAGGKFFFEQKYAIDQMMQPVAWFDKQAWFRTIADVLIVNGPVARAVDWKTGKVQEDSLQLALISAVIFSHYQDVQAIRTEFVWLAHDAVTREDFKRTDLPKIWAQAMPRVKEYQHAVTTMAFPPKPGGLCKKYCPVTSCPFWGKGGR